MHTKKRVPLGKKLTTVDKILLQFELRTVCQEARCPNINECFDSGTATFLILGDVCTRNCQFCSIQSGKPQKIDNQEPMRIASAAKKLNLNYVVITSVTRDDLDDGGSSHFAETIKKLRNELPQDEIEVLVPDFKFNKDAIKKVLSAKPDVFNHNLETVERLYPMVRPQANYTQSLQVLEYAAKLHTEIVTKSGIMVGLGETIDELKKVFDDLVSVGCQILTIGQYYQADKKLLPVKKFYSDEEFIELRQMSMSAGFEYVAAGRYVRSSYKAKAAYKILHNNNTQPE